MDENFGQKPVGRKGVGRKLGARTGTLLNPTIGAQHLRSNVDPRLTQENDERRSTREKEYEDYRGKKCEDYIIYVCERGVALQLYNQII